MNTKSSLAKEVSEAAKDKTVYLTVIGKVRLSDDEVSSEVAESTGTGCIVYSMSGVTLMVSCGHVVKSCLDPEINAELYVSFHKDISNEYPAKLLSDSLMAKDEFSMFYVSEDTIRSRFEFCENIRLPMCVASLSFASGNPWISTGIGYLSNADGECGVFDERGVRLCYAVATDPGSSGSPIVDMDGKLVAVHVGASSQRSRSSPKNIDQRYYHSGNFKYGLHIDSVKEFMLDIVGRPRRLPPGLDIDVIMGMICGNNAEGINITRTDRERIEYISRFHPVPSLDSIPSSVDYSERCLEVLVTPDSEKLFRAVRDKKSTFLHQIAANDSVIGDTIGILRGMYGNEGVSVTAYTPEAANDLGCDLLESFVGGNFKVEEMVPFYYTVRDNNEKAVENWKRTEALVIYGVNLMDRKSFFKLEHVARKLRRPENVAYEFPWGGIQLVLIGDLQQIPPQPKDDKVFFFYIDSEDNGIIGVSEGYPLSFKTKLILDAGFALNRTALYEMFRTWKLPLVKCRINAVLI